MKKIVLTALSAAICVAAHAQVEQKERRDTIVRMEPLKTCYVVAPARPCKTACVIVTRRVARMYYYTNTNDLVAAMTGAYQRRRGDDVSFFGGR